ncbi:MAG TPA: universal stress protein [Candidatus Acidoferrales bacterium]|jgi:nucleotide-binding universal stress UspA family protein|nr:universal stress protein [Candidatus Acidoferrales bacterium]
MMLEIKRILLPVDFPNAPLRVIHQAATLAHHFHSELLMLHAVTAASHAAGVPDAGSKLAGWDLLEEIIRDAQNKQDQTLGLELDGLTIRRMLVKANPAHAIVQVIARQEKADLIMMAPSGFMFDQFLLSSVSAKVLKATECPLWTSAHAEESHSQRFAIHNILCVIEFNSHGHKSLSFAKQMAAEFGARLTLAHVTAGVELWGPGGYHVNTAWKKELVSDASRQIAELQSEMDIQADVFIGSGEPPKVLSHAARHTKADLLITGSYPYGVNLRTHAYGIISSMAIPVLSM